MANHKVLVLGWSDSATVHIVDLTNGKECRRSFPWQEAIDGATATASTGQIIADCDDDVSYHITLDGDTVNVMSPLFQSFADSISIENSDLVIRRVSNPAVAWGILSPDGTVWRNIDFTTEVATLGAFSDTPPQQAVFHQGEVVFVMRDSGLSQWFIMRIPSTGAITLLPLPTPETAYGGTYFPRYTSNAFLVLPEQFIVTSTTGENRYWSVDASWVVTGGETTVFDDPLASNIRLFVEDSYPAKLTNNQFVLYAQNPFGDPLDFMIQSSKFIRVDTSNMTSVNFTLETPTVGQIPNIADIISSTFTGGAIGLMSSGNIFSTTSFYTNPSGNRVSEGTIIEWNGTTGLIAQVLPYTVDTYGANVRNDWVISVDIPVYEISGTVTSAATPVNGAEVTIYSTVDGALLDRTATDVTGDYTVQLYTATPKGVAVKLPGGDIKIHSVTPTVII